MMPLWCDSKHIIGSMEHTANTKQQLLAKIKRGEKLFGNEVTQAVAFGLGEPYVAANGDIALKPYNYRTPCGCRTIVPSSPP